MLDADLENALDRMYEEAYLQDEKVPLFDGPDFPLTGEMLWLDRSYSAVLCTAPGDHGRYVTVSGHVIMLDEIDYVKAGSSNQRLLWVKVLTDQGIGWTRGSFLTRR